MGLPFLVGGVILVLAWLIGLGRDSFLIDFGADNRLDLVYIQTEEGGFFNPEKQQGETPFPNYDNNYRWTGRISYINLPWPLDATPLKATLRATAPRPDRSPDESGTTLTISGLLNNSSIDLGKYPLTGLYDGTELTFRLPGHLRPTLERFRLRFESSETWQPSKSDTRNLSALFFSLKLEPDYVAFGWQDWLASWVQPGLLALLTFTTWGLAGLFTSRQGWRLALEIMAGLLLLISLFGWPQAAEPFYTPWALILLAAWGLLWLAGRFADQAPCLPAPFVYAATLLPGLPLAQLIFGRLELTSLSNGSVSIALYFGALLVSLVGYLWLRHKFELIFSGAFLLAAALIFIYTHWQVYAFNLYRGADFRNYYLALLDLEQYHTPLYSLEEMATLPGQAVRSAPIFAVLFWPLARLFGRDINMALLFWRVSNELLLLPTLLIFGQVFGRFRAGLKLWPAMLFLVLSFGQLAETAAYGQQNFMLLFGLALLALWVKQHRDTLGGMALSLPIWVKLLPGISVAFFLIERRWRGLVGLVLGALLVNVLTVAVVGWDNVWFYFSKAMWSVNEPELGISNQSWWGFIGRLGVHEVKGDFVGGYPTHLAPLGYLGALLGVGLTLLILWRARGGDWLHDQLKLGALALVGLWVPPFSWMHYIVLGLVAIMALLVVLSREGTPRSHLIIFALAYVLLAYGGLQEFFFTQAAGLALLGSSYRFLATFALWVLSLWLLWQPSYKSLVAPSI
ncbi:MAG: DUF2029 domain-containing protein [Chloroflexi bacterium]|nr:DUF2029 domain-containing protein [Chloroflexota bacterium]